MFVALVHFSCLAGESVLKMAFKVAIVGAGVTGLSCATVIQERFPDVALTLFAEKFSPGTTSDGAAGLFAPYLIGDTPAEEVRYGARSHTPACRWQ